MQTHAALPTVVEVDGDEVLSFCAGRDAEGRGQIGAVRFSPLHNRLIDCASQPILTHGELGAFDDRGVLPSCVVRSGARWIMYYTGVMLGQTVPFYFAVGAATSDDFSHWQRVSRAPILERNAVDPLMTASPCVIFDEGRFRMWYVSCLKWEATNGEPRHYYHIRYAESSDGLRWEREGRVAIDFSGDEYALGRPCVIHDGDRYRMWFPYRGDHYRIGYAESSDGLLWERKDQSSVLTGEPGEWEREMQCYPWIFDAGGTRYMAYNGDGYGRTGFGIARLVI